MQTNLFLRFLTQPIFEDFELQKFIQRQYFQMQEKEKEQQVKRITDEILLRVKAVFESHKRKVEKLNSEKNSGGMMKNQLKQSFYEPITDILQELKNLNKAIRKCQKLRKQRRLLYENNTMNFIDTLQMIRKNKHMIKIKIDNHLISILEGTRVAIDEAISSLRNFEKEASVFCGKSYDYKPAVEKFMTEVAQFGFLWNNIGKFDSVTNDSVQEIYLPVRYEENEFRNIQNQIKNVWPSPKVQVIRQQVKVPEIQVKDDSHLREAHEMLFGFTRSENPFVAIEMYRKEGEKSNCHPTALNALGEIYEKGKFLQKDLTKAVSYYRKSAEKNDAQGLYKIGQYLQKGLINSKEYFSGMYPNREAEIRGGIEYYEKAAKLGHLDAMTDLGFIYEKGIESDDGRGYFIDPHPEHALKYYLKAKKQEFPRSYNNLGALYIKCPDLPEEVESGNLLKGIKYLKKAVELKYPRAFYNLGKCFENGVGVSQNIDESRSLYLKGGEIGDVQCKLEYVKSHLGCKLSDEKTLLKMVELTRQILVQNSRNAEALFYMGLFAEKGIGMDINKESSFYYVESAARLDYPPAITKLGDFYYSGFHVHKNIDYAKMLYEKAAEKSEAKALVNLGILAQKGIGMEENDMNKAQTLYEQAAELGNPNGFVFLSLMGKKSQQTQALVKAAEMGSFQAIKIMKEGHRSLLPKKDNKAKTYTQALKAVQSHYIKKSKQSQFQH